MENWEEREIDWLRKCEIVRRIYFQRVRESETMTMRVSFEMSERRGQV